MKVHIARYCHDLLVPSEPLHGRESQTFLAILRHSELELENDTKTGKVERLVKIILHSSLVKGARVVSPLGETKEIGSWTSQKYQLAMISLRYPLKFS